MFGWFSRSEKREQETGFEHIMAFARSLAANNPDALADLVRVLLRPLQSELLLSAIENKLHGARDGIVDHRFFMPNGPSDIQMAFDCPRLDSDGFWVQLDRDPVLPCPWNKGCYVRALAEIGHGKSAGDWQEDPSNHFVTVWLPWGIAFANGGNHSIAAGIIGGEGQLRPNEVYDMAKLLGLVQCDGVHYRSVSDGKILDQVQDIRIAAVFEIGRLLQAKGIKPMAATATPSALIKQGSGI
jgi:hypothetical protein